MQPALVYEIRVEQDHDWDVAARTPVGCPVTPTRNPSISRTRPPGCLESVFAAVAAMLVTIKVRCVA